tara:strand:+ start:2874 stop:3416 length:543 start_codon:yes stop_codon:yes gene_type:complete
MAGALVAVFPPDAHWKADPVTLCALATAILAWLASTLQGAGANNPHDVRLFEEFTNLVDDDERRFLDTQDFGTLFRRSSFDGIRTIYADWDGPRRDFTDKRLQRVWHPLRQQVNILTELIVASTMPATNSEFQTVMTSRDHEDGVSEHTRAEIKAMNEAACELVKRLDKFELRARQILRP